MFEFGNGVGANRLPPTVQHDVNVPDSGLRLGTIMSGIHPALIAMCK